LTPDSLQLQKTPRTFLYTPSKAPGLCFKKFTPQLTARTKMYSLQSLSNLSQLLFCQLHTPVSLQPVPATLLSATHAQPLTNLSQLLSCQLHTHSLSPTCPSYSPVSYTCTASHQPVPYTPVSLQPAPAILSCQLHTPVSLRPVPATLLSATHSSP